MYKIRYEVRFSRLEDTCCNEKPCVSLNEGTTVSLSCTDDEFIARVVALVCRSLLVRGRKRKKVG